MVCLSHARAPYIDDQTKSKNSDKSHPSSLELALKLHVQPSSLVVKGIGVPIQGMKTGYVHRNLRLFGRKSEEYKRVLRCRALVEMYEKILMVLELLKLHLGIYMNWVNSETRPNLLKKTDWVILLVASI